MRGVESFGMLCSAKELGLAEESSGLLLLPADAPAGTSIRDYLDLDDKLFTLKLTPNRSDCLSLIGVAREVAAVTGAELAVPQTESVQSGECWHGLPVVVAEPAACPRYCGRVVRGVNTGGGHAGVDGAPPGAFRLAQHQCGGGCDQLRDARTWASRCTLLIWRKFRAALQVRFAQDGEQLDTAQSAEVELASGHAGDCR